MPIVIVLDVSLSMSRPVPVVDGTPEFTRRQLAIVAINTLLDHLERHCRLEFVSFIIFSSLWENKVSFTRDYDSIRSALNDLQEFSKTCLSSAVAAAKSSLLEEFGIRTPGQVIIFTDGNVGVGSGSLKDDLQGLDMVTESQRDFPCKIQIVCISPPKDPALEVSLPLYRKLIALSTDHGDVYLPDSVLSVSSVKLLMETLNVAHFNPFEAKLHCGHLSSSVNLHPAPEIYDKDHDFQHIKKGVSSKLNICGFLDISDIASPPFISKHLVLPVSSKSGLTDHSSDQEDSKDDEPAFTVLLHGSLKVEAMIALVEISEDWYGMMFSWADSKKKSNLMLSIFEPGAKAIPWLGNMQHLAPMQDFTTPPYGEDSNKSPFPVRPSERRSYAQNCVVWIKHSGLQADIQKMLRNARKLPEKQPHFYKELNRVRRAALSFGFYELLESAAQLLERECTQLPGNAHPDAAFQLTHAITECSQGGNS
ncbi:hypothetical protein CAPTEDRAFT_229105 [Capitella teleta]|uniref:Integrator complex subunit 14 n=1 Tax=Capitella teleta TaxID=283909 RepID=R7UFP2_CAPTE|nr:hypothetical protein CAPTEDRAFT_229105 [Capitella teleta]|eukprot:ELU02608.1 hypothetical protein CAPTEDRAFT_229105 [Capitella teleta]